MLQEKLGGVLSAYPLAVPAAVILGGLAQRAHAAHRAVRLAAPRHPGGGVGLHHRSHVRRVGVGLSVWPALVQPRPAQRLPNKKMRTQF